MKPLSNNLRSIFAMVMAVACFSLMDAAMKLLSTHYPPIQIAAIRGLAALPLVCAYVIWRGALRSLLRVRWSLHFLRAGLGILMLSLFAYALQLLPLAGAYAIFFIAPLLITALSVPFLKEKIEAARWSAIGLGLIGVVVVLRPSSAGIFTLGGLAVLTAALCYAISAITVRMLSYTDSIESMIFWLALMVALGAGVLAIPVWTAVRSSDWLLIAGLGLSSFWGQLLITDAFRHGEVSAVAPFEYIGLAWGIGLDWLLWHTLPDRYTLLGAAIIIASGLYLIRRERMHVESEHP